MKQRFAMGTLGCMVSALVLTGCATLPESMPIIVTPPVDNSVHVQTQSQQVIQANEASALNGEKHGLIRQADACLDVHGDDGRQRRVDGGDHRGPGWPDLGLARHPGTQHGGGCRWRLYRYRNGL